MPPAGVLPRRPKVEGEHPHCRTIRIARRCYVSPTNQGPKTALPHVSA
jgi:hypothetical protein